MPKGGESHPGNEEIEGVVFRGKVKAFNEKAGRGFIDCQEAKDKYGQDVYVHGSVMEKAQAYVGDEVEFKIHLNSQGQPQAQSPMEVVGSAMEEKYQYRGIVKSFSEKNGYGFIECEQLKAEYKRDVYLPGSHAQSCGAYQGLEIMFNIDLNADGMPVASEVFARGSGGKGGKAAKGKDSWGKDSWGKDSWGKDSGGKGGWGKDSWGKDSWGKDSWGKDSKGKADGKGAKKGGTQYAPGFEPGGKGKSSASAAPKLQPKVVKPPAKPPPAKLLKKAEELPAEEAEEEAEEEVALDEVLYGKVKSFNTEKGYGFVECAATFKQYGHDINIPKGVASDLTAGLQVGFRLGLNEDEMPIVAEIWPESPPARGAKRKLPAQAQEQRKSARQSADQPEEGEPGAAEQLEEEVHTPVDEPMEEEEAVEEEAFEEEAVEQEEGEEFAEEPMEGDEMEETPEASEGTEGKEMYEGEIIRYEMASNRGFIACEGVSATFGVDVYVHQKVLAQAKAQVGDVVRFAIHVNSQNLPQASHPLTIVSSNGPKLEYKGVIKSFSEKNGYGFVESPEVKEKHGRDAYLPGSKAQGCHQGMEVYFDVDLNNDGQPVVKEMYPAQIESCKGVSKGGSGWKDAGSKGGTKSGSSKGKDKSGGGGGSWSYEKQGPRPVGSYEKGGGGKGWDNGGSKGWSGDWGSKGGGGAKGPKGGGGALGPGTSRSAAGTVRSAGGTVRLADLQPKTGGGALGPAPAGARPRTVPPPPAPVRGGMLKPTVSRSGAAAPAGKGKSAPAGKGKGLVKGAKK